MNLILISLRCYDIGVRGFSTNQQDGNRNVHVRFFVFVCVLFTCRRKCTFKQYLYTGVLVGLNVNANVHVYVFAHAPVEI